MGRCPGRLSNNVGRHITVTETCTMGPRMLLVSRPFKTLSTRAEARLRARLLGA